MNQIRPHGHLLFVTAYLVSGVRADAPPAAEPEARVIREAYVLLCGKYPHPQTIVPGGMSTTLSTSTFNEFYVRLAQFFDYAKRVVPLWDDLCDFFYDANPAYRQVGVRPKNLVDTGIWDHHEVYDATYANAGRWGDRRWATPG